MYWKLTLIPFVLALACGSDVEPGQASWEFNEHQTPTDSIGDPGDGSPSPAERTGEEQPAGEPGVTVAVRAVIRDYCDQDTERFCRVVYECPESFDDRPYFQQLQWMGVYDYDSCVSYFAGTDVCRLEGQVERGNVVVDAEALDACLRAEDDHCGYLECTGEAIQTVGEDGDRCVFGSECTSGVCHGSWSTGECSVEFGTCGPRRDIGELCEFGSDCAQGLLCNAGKCNQPGGEGASCSDWEDCRHGLWCVTNGDRNHCAEPVSAGEPCDPGASVDGSPSSPLVCDPVTLYCDDVSETCVPFKPIGEPCDFNECDPASAICLEGRCEAIRSLGESCQPYQCGYRLTCFEGTCERRDQLIGEPCDQDGQCLYVLMCIDGRCAPGPGDGEPCYNGTCQYFAHCDDGVCVADWKRAACEETGVTPFDD